MIASYLSHRCLQVSAVFVVVTFSMAIDAMAQPPTRSITQHKAAQTSAAAQQVDNAFIGHKRRSLFYAPEEMSDINYAINIFKKNTDSLYVDDDFNEEDFLSRLTGFGKAPKTNRYYKYPQFFLESLVYHGADNWIIWVNGQKITQDSPTDTADLSVIEIGKDKVSLRWRPVSMKKVNSVWGNSISDLVKVHKRRGLVEFILSPNQTFSSYVMDVLEGKVQPVTIDTHAVSLLEDVARYEKEGGDEQPKDESSDKNEERKGLGGLIGAYKRLGQDKPTQDTKPTP